LKTQNIRKKKEIIKIKRDLYGPLTSFLAHFLFCLAQPSLRFGADIKAPLGSRASAYTLPPFTGPRDPLGGRSFARTARPAFHYAVGPRCQAPSSSANELDAIDGGVRGIHAGPLNRTRLRASCPPSYKYFATTCWLISPSLLCRLAPRRPSRQQPPPVILLCARARVRACGWGRSPGTREANRAFNLNCMASGTPEFLVSLPPPSWNRTTAWAEKSPPRFEVKLPPSSLVPSPLRIAPLGSKF
jgi:hypothetical protein